MCCHENKKSSLFGTAEEWDKEEWLGQRRVALETLVGSWMEVSCGLHCCCSLAGSARKVVSQHPWRAYKPVSNSQHIKACDLLGRDAGQRADSVALGTLVIGAGEAFSLESFEAKTI